MDEAQPQLSPLRLFVSIELPEHVRTAIARAQSQLRSAAPEGAVRWTQSNQFHLTLKFLGSVPTSQVDALFEALQSACATFAPLDLGAQGIGFFPDRRFPRVVWVGIDDAGGTLPALATRIESAVAPFTKEERPEHFSGHITLGRIKMLKPQFVKQLVDRAATFSDSFGRWTARRITLMRSELLPSGARHSPIKEIELRVFT